MVILVGSLPKRHPNLRPPKSKIFINRMVRLRRAFARLSRFATAVIQKLFRVTPGRLYTVTEVHNAMDTWNNCAKQLATTVAVSFVGSFTFVNAAPTQEQTSAAQRISKYTIPGLVQSLGTRTPEEMVARLQSAFEACLAFAVYQTPPAATERFNITVSSVDERLVQDAESSIIEGIYDILSVAGCTATLPNIKSQVTSRFQELHASLFDVPAGSLYEVLHYTTSSDCEMFIARPHEEFRLEGMGVDDDNRQEGRVVCTTSIGLRSGQVVVLKALVLLESFLG